MELLYPPPQLGPPAAEAPEERLSEGNWADSEKATLRAAIEHFQGHPIRTLEEVQHLSDEEKKLPFKWSVVALWCQQRGCRRNAKQCRERYINHMAPLRRDRIGPEEGQDIMNYVAHEGRKWAILGRKLNRAENTIKNYWNQERKKGENGRRRNASQSQPSRQSQIGRQQSLPQSYYQPMREQPHSRRESLCSNPGLVSDHGSPIENSPRSSRHNSFAPIQQLPLPSFQGWKPVPASPLQLSYPMDRTQALSGSSTYSAYSQGDAPSPIQEYPHYPHHFGTRLVSSYPERRHGFNDHPGQQVQQPHYGLEHPSYTHGHTQIRETHHDRSYSYTAPQQAPATSQTYRAQRLLPPLSSLMSFTRDADESTQLPSTGARPRNTQGSSGNMDIRNLLN
ncbi:hypothetical protein N0V82_000760 [Gnomoniopsis sp. IMI 355080]|nr:hypothetical protein N0V82_000760 [Gnomoniopsis sp. IMI 355080]